jgi:hypothetical protein
MKTMSTVQDAVFSGFIRMPLQMNWLKLKSVPHVFRKHGHPLVVNAFSRIDTIVQNNIPNLYILYFAHDFLLSLIERQAEGIWLPPSPKAMAGREDC